jgi:hypothetical protein
MICPHCGYEIDGVQTCPLCGSHMHAGSSTETGTVGSDSVRSGPGSGTPPWEDARIPFPNNLIATCQKSLVEPTRFFDGIRYDAPAARPLLYFLVLTVMGAVFTLLWQALELEPVSVFEGAVEDIRGPSALIQFFLSPFLGLLGLLLWSLILHLFVLMFAPNRRNLVTTIRVVCYSAAPLIFLVVPYVGSWVAQLWMLVLQVFGVRAAHRTTGGRATAAVLIPIVLLMLLVMLTAFLMVFVTGAVLEDFR